ncbi:MAG TPA: peptidylprolyl isomerase [Methanomethylovorans sp.]|nr:peptidylprolyl isomerase [Methanomethylovorans sp.]
MKKICLLLILSIIAFSSGCADNGQSEIVEKGDNISVNYVGKYDNGTVFDTSWINVSKEAGLYDASRNYEPLSFVVGAGQMISGFDNGVLNMTIGEKKTLKLSPDEAYGEYKEEYLVPVPRSDLENNSIVPEIGKQVGTLMGVATIVDITDTNVTLDFNSPLAGKNLTFDVEVVSIEKASK